MHTTTYTTQHAPIAKDVELKRVPRRRGVGDMITRARVFAVGVLIIIIIMWLL